MNKDYQLIFCGGGSGGHVIPALTVIKKLKKEGVSNFLYIGSYKGVESKLVQSQEISYRGISTGKLRRYFSFENALDFLRVLLGIVQSYLILFKFSRKKSLVVSFGGFVSVPVVLAAWLQGKKVIIHEQTSRVGLANKLASRFSKKVLISFEASKQYYDSSKTVLTGYPLREECMTDDLKHSIFEEVSLLSPPLPILFITGGGNGSKLLNDIIKDHLDYFEKEYLVIHQVGERFIEEYKILRTKTYIPISFVKEEMIDLFKSSTVIISRAGAGTVCELLGLRKKSLFVPLKIAQKNEQYHNAIEAREKLGSIVIEEDNLNFETLSKGISELKSQNEVEPHSKSALNGLNNIVQVIKDEAWD